MADDYPDADREASPVVRGDGEERHREDRDRERDRERRQRDDRGGRGERDDRDRSDRRHRDERDRDQDRDRDHERDRRGSRSGENRDRERRKSREYTKSRSRSRSPRERSERRSKRQSGFDMGPAGATIAPMTIPGMMTNPAVAGVMPSIGAMAGQLGLGQPGMPNMFPNMFPMMGTQATRHARRVYVGGLPPMANEQSVATFFSHAMSAIGGNTAGPGDAVVYVYINQEKKFAFVECRTVEEASNAMALDGIVYEVLDWASSPWDGICILHAGDAVVNVYINQEKKFAFVEMRTVEEASNGIALDGIIIEGVSVRVRRPSDYNPSMAATLGPSQPSPHLNLAAVGLTPGFGGSTGGGADGPDRIFVGGLPYYLTEEQIKELLSSFGPLRAFDLVKDRDTGNSKGYGFCVYQDPSIVDVAIAALDGMKLGDKTLTVRRATASGQPKPDQGNVLQQAQQQIALQFAMGLGTGANTMPLGMGSLPNMPIGLPPMMPEIPTRVVCLAQVVAPKELVADEEYEEILEDMREECGKYGTLANLVIPRPGPNGEALPGVGKVFVEYTDAAGSQKAKQSLNGRKFGGNSVVAIYYPEDRFARGDYVGQ